MTAINGVHDPTIIEHEGTFYLYSTDIQQPKTAGVPIRSSKDLIHWQLEKQALSEMPEPAVKWSKAQGLWAPEVIRYKDEFRMYYSASTFGSTTSFIGLATASDPLGPWEDQGEVVKTNATLAQHNAIDANIAFDRSGEQWFVYGSFFGGIYIAPLNKETGKLQEKSYGQRIAFRPKTVDTAIEGPFIYYHPETDYYYLFVSFDSLNDSYNIRVARAKEITGPYLDWHGTAMTDQEKTPTEVGTKLLGSYQFSEEPVVYAPGHNSIFTQSNKESFVVHHARRKPFSGQFHLQIRKLYWLESGWPVISASIYQRSVSRMPEQETLLGKWEIIQFDYESQIISSQQHEITELKKEGRSYLWEGNEFVPYYEYIDQKERLFFSGINDQGVAFLGRKVCEE